VPQKFLWGGPKSPPKLFSQARCLCHNNSCGVGRRARPNYLHRQDACATKILVGWAEEPAQTIFTGKMPVPQGFHRQDACATTILVGWASCPPQTI
ncbi:hypothetical protein, partial [Microcoleus sp. D3_18a_C4]|uniref:hypothetical protein n=1 Tax=Microcoleus sp. D3_18a_C4 TaxID=3055332 RepID=UPI002FD0F4B6